MFKSHGCKRRANSAEPVGTRLAAKFTHKALSFSSGVDRTYISERENDLKSPTVDTLERLCKAMGIKASQLLAKVEAGSRGKKAIPVVVDDQPT